MTPWHSWAYGVRNVSMPTVWCEGGWHRSRTTPVITRRRLHRSNLPHEPRPPLAPHREMRARHVLGIPYVDGLSSEGDLDATVALGANGR